MHTSARVRIHVWTRNVQFMVAIIIARFQLPTRRNECGVNYVHTLDKIEFLFKCFHITLHPKKGLRSILLFAFPLVVETVRMYVFDIWCGKENFNFAKKLSYFHFPNPAKIKWNLWRSSTTHNRGNIPEKLSTFIRCVTSRHVFVHT